MSQATQSAADTAPSRDVLDRVSAGYGPRDFAVRFWDGSTIDPDPGHDARFTLVVNHAGALRQMFWPFNKASVGEAYIYGDIDIEGDIERFVETMVQWRKVRYSGPLTARLGLFRRLLALPNDARPRPGRAARLSGGQHSLDRDKQAIEYHYDGPPSEFYALVLGRQMLYTCAYFADPAEDIDTAQARKAEHICRKLRLKPGERLIDFGCGWGGLILYAAKHYGVHATGVSISKEQITWAEREIDRQGLRDRCRVLYCDYRQAPEDQPFDKAVSVGFAEHLGERNLPVFFGKVWRLLRPGGQYLHHVITMRPFTPFPPWRAFTLRYVFPDAELVPIGDTLTQLGKAGFEVRDVESLREHYAYTLRCWLRNLEKNRAEAVQIAGEVTYRIYRIFFAGAALGFRSATYNLNQTLVVKSGDGASGLPLTRADWYR